MLPVAIEVVMKSQKKLTKELNMNLELLLVSVLALTKFLQN